MGELVHGDITAQILGAAIEVWKVLGYGFLEKVYENSLLEELRRLGLNLVQQVGIDVRYKSVLVGQYVADLLVDGKVLIELKTEKEYNPIHEAQVLNYLKATGIKVGMLINFGKEKCQWKRLVF